MPHAPVVFRTDLHKMKINTELCCKRYEFIVSKQCACLKRVHIEGHMNRFEFLLSWTIIPIMIVLGLFCQKIVSFAA
jgi:hypothetical protein